MPKRATKLTAGQIAKLSPKPGKNSTFHPVGGVAGLHLQQTPSGAASWALRVKYGGKRRWIGLGPYPEIKLATAYERALEAKEQIAAGVDPIAHRRATRAALAVSEGITFAKAVEDYLSAKLDEFRNEKHRKQWRSTLDTYATPVIGKSPVSEITVHDVVKVLKPIWTTKTETASRLRGRIENVLAWATVNGHRDGDNPARWRGNLDAILPKPSKVSKEVHHAAIPVTDAAAWFKALRGRDGTAARALEFLTLTAARSGEVRGATWAEIDLDAGVWTIPADRMKAGKEHAVPLTKAALAILDAMPQDGRFVFPAPKGGALSDMALSAVMRRMHKAKVEADGIGWVDRQSGKAAVPHGLRSTFRDWAAEKGVDRDLAEICLAHRVGGDVERAYRRSDMFGRRVEVMQDWARQLGGL